MHDASDTNSDSNCSVAAVIVRDRTVLLALRLPGGSIGGLWEFPGGKVDEEEGEKQALVRELGEELGVRATVHELMASGRFAHRGVPFRLSAYRVQLQPPDATRFTLSEHSETRWVAWDDVSSYAMPESDRTVWPAILSRLREQAETTHSSAD
ncbi:MAG: NUDIX domain-containing protein [Spirochaetaceae bacterium]|nr:MAG: NUDIX domain-containing protein [Spirochaetaceae bacterium]